MNETVGKVLEREEEKLLEYGSAIKRVLGSVIPLFGGILDLGIPVVKKLVGMRREVADIQRKGRLDYFEALVKAGAESKDATAILRQEVDLDHAGFFRSFEVVGSLGPAVAGVVDMVLPILKGGFSKPPGRELRW